LAKGSNKVREAFPGSFLDVPSKEIVQKPVETLRKISTATVDPVPSITHDFIEWTAEQKNTVYDMMKKYPFFEGYSFHK